VGVRNFGSHWTICFEHWLICGFAWFVLWWLVLSGWVRGPCAFPNLLISWVILVWHACMLWLDDMLLQKLWLLHLTSARRLLFPKTIGTRSKNSTNFPSWEPFLLEQLLLLLLLLEMLDLRIAFHPRTTRKVYMDWFIWHTVLAECAINLFNLYDEQLSFHWWCSYL